MHLRATLGHALSSMFHQSQTSSVAAMLCTASFRLPSLAQTMHTVWPELCGHPICVLCVWGWYSWFGLWQQFGEEAFLFQHDNAQEILQMRGQNT